MRMDEPGNADHNKTADVCFVLEGTYPYVPGGVSSWVHQIISGLPQLTFALAIIMPKKDASRKFKYDVPRNVISMREIYLHEPGLPDTKADKLDNKSWDHLLEFHKTPDSDEKVCLYGKLFKNFFDENTRKIAPALLQNSEKAWSMFTKLYKEEAPKASFLDYFWSVRFIHQPLFKVLTAELPQARIYHPVSTGYAGLWATTAKMRWNKPVILTEHGIYTRERRFEIARADWIYEQSGNEARITSSQSRFRDMWNRMFALQSYLTYAHADEIITLHEKNQNYQIEDGAPRNRLKIIPNGVDVKTLRTLKNRSEGDHPDFVVGFMGRVVSIKDVKTLIRACKTASARIPELKVLIMGPTEEEPQYYKECLKLTEVLGMEKIITYTGKISTLDYYPKIDLLALTSISEAQPLVILEANSLGIPCIATDVGACRELLHGREGEDSALGQSGIITGVTNAKVIAEAIITIYKSPGLRRKMGEAGKKRVARYYDIDALLEEYLNLYGNYLQLAAVA